MLWDKLWVKYYLVTVFVFFTGNKTIHAYFHLVLSGYNNNFMYATEYKVRGDMTGVADIEHTQLWFYYGMCEGGILRVSARRHQETKVSEEEIDST